MPQWRKMSALLGLALAFVAAVVGPHVVLGDDVVQMAIPPRQNCVGDNQRGCPNSADCPTPAAGVYWCDRNQGPESKTCQGVGPDRCIGKGGIDGVCGTKMTCGGNLPVLEPCGTDTNGNPKFCEASCSERANWCWTFAN